jgi:hypothetical protein
MFKGLSLTVSMLLVASVATGCAIGRSPSDSSDGDEPPIGQLLNVNDLRTFALPLDPYIMSGENLSATTRAEHVLIRECVARFGFDYQLPPPPNPAVKGKERRYGISDENQAAVWGYHVPAEPDDSSGYVEPAGDVVAVITGRGRSSYGGQQVPEGGCVAEARRKLAESAPRPANERLADDLAGTSANRTHEHSQVKKATEGWSACMKKAGYEYSDPRKAINDPAFSGDVATPEEINVALADIRCKKESNFINVMATVETAYQKRALERNAAALAIIKENFDARERNAAAILAGQ